MDEQRLQAYYQLIQQLLSCPHGEEAAILQANRELLDVGFLQVVVGVAETFTQQGEENTANWLLALASQLSEELDIPLTPEPETPVNEADFDTYFQFLSEVLQATAESEYNPQVVYPLLAANTDKLNLTFVELLRLWATNTLEEAEPHTAKSIAVVIGNFSNLIQQFPLGNKADNMEIAITGYEIAFTVFTRDTSPEQWGTLQNNLAAAYSDRISGDKADNLEIAIAAYNKALEVYTPADFPVQWAMTQNNLGNAYNNRIRGDKADNLEKAIAAYNKALEVYTPADFPQEWARTQNNLGTAYSDRISGDKADNLEIAIAAYNKALEVRTRTDFPVQWAGAQNNLGNAYRDRISGDKADNLENAIAAYNKALEVRTRTDFPVEWAGTQNNLGNAYRDRIRGDKADNLEKAIAAYNAALEVRTRTDFPVENAKTLFNLGIAYQDSQQFDLAYDTFKSAIATVEDIRGEIISGEESKRKQAEEWNKLFVLMVEVCLGLGKETEAISYIERSKTRNLVEQILSRDLKTIFPAEIVTQLEQLRDEIASGQNLLQTGKAENPETLRQHLQQLRQQSQQLQDQYLPIGASFNFASLEQIVDNNTAIIEWYITFDKILSFVIQPGGQEIRIWQSSSADRDALRDWVNKYLADYYNQKDQWENQLKQSLQKLAEILHIEEILQRIPPQCEKLILIPHQFLHLLPLHALPVQDSYLMDLFPQGVGYAPSLQILQQTQLRQRDNFQSLFAIQTPTEDLYEEDLGAVAAIKKQFDKDKSHVLKNENAKKSAIIPNNQTLNTANNLFFFCHGKFDESSTFDSRLLLAGCFVPSELIKQDPKRYKIVSEYKDKAVDLVKCLTLADIITHLKLENCRLVTLAACETGITDFTSTSDEYIGLPNGFLLAGSTNVVSSLWNVSRRATALLMVRFYQELKYQELKQRLLKKQKKKFLAKKRNHFKKEC
jgi:CHAT domain-containing protein